MACRPIGDGGIIRQGEPFVENHLPQLILERRCSLKHHLSVKSQGQGRDQGAGYAVGRKQHGQWLCGHRGQSFGHFQLPYDRLRHSLEVRYRVARALAVAHEKHICVPNEGALDAHTEEAAAIACLPTPGVEDTNRARSLDDPGITQNLRGMPAHPGYQRLAQLHHLLYGGRLYLRIEDLNLGIGLRGR